MIKEIKKWIVIALSFILTLWLIWASYAAWFELTDVESWNPLTSDLFNKVLENQRDLKINVDSLTSSNVDMPIWSIIAWHKDLAWVPALPNGWVECDGSVISDIDSPLNWVNTPNLNNQVYSGWRWKYLRWWNTSWVMNNSTSWQSAWWKSYWGTWWYYWAWVLTWKNMEKSSSRQSYSASAIWADYVQVTAMTVVYIMKIK